MKKLIVLISMIWAGVSAVHSQTIKECSVYTPVKPVIIPKGGDFVYKKPAQAKMLEKHVIKTRQVKSEDICSISLYNYNGQTIHVYLDSVYSGSIDANSIGVINNISSESALYCITDDQEYSWEDHADCSCKLTFHLRIKKGEGEIKP